jgi:hypothetical protein
MKAEKVPIKDPGILEEFKDVLLEIIFEIKNMLNKEGDYFAKVLIISVFLMFVIMIGILIYACV